METLHALALATGGAPPRHAPAPPSSGAEQPPAPTRAPASAIEEGAEARPATWDESIGIAAFSIASTSPAPRWTPPETPARCVVAPKATSVAPGYIGIESFSIAPWDPTRRPTKKRARHEDVYDITRDELAERLHDWRQSRRIPSRFRGELTNRHRLVMAMKPGSWYTSPAIQELIGLPLKDVTAMLRQMSQWPLLYVEKADLPEAYREPSYLVPAPYGRGGKTRRSPAQFMYRLTESGRELKLEGEDFAARGEAT